MSLVAVLPLAARTQQDYKAYQNYDVTAGERNTTLSQARADAVKRLLVERGIDASRLTTKGYGATRPLGPNDSPEARANNRRVEFTRVA